MAPNMALQRTRRPSLRSGRSLRSLGSPLNAYPLGGHQDGIHQPFRGRIASMANSQRETKMNLLDAKRARFVARVGGVLYLIIIVLGALGEAVVRGSIVVPGNATATAANLRSMEWLWRLGVAGEVVLLTCATALALILYILLRRVSRDLALAAVFFNLV